LSNDSNQRKLTPTYTTETYKKPHEKKITTMPVPNHVTNPYHEAFDNFEFTQAMADSLEMHVSQEFRLEDVPATMTLALTGQTDFQDRRGTFEQTTNQNSAYYTLSPGSHDPLDRAARAEQFANLRQDHREAAERGLAARRRAHANLEAGIPEPSHSAWEDAAGIAEGEAISQAQYGSHEHLYRESTLAEPEFEPAGPPANYCRAEHGRIQEFTFMTAEERASAVLEERADSARRLKRELDGDMLYKKLRQTQSEHTAKFKAFMDLFNQWKIDDPETSAKFIKHLVDANMCSTSNVRIWQITAWFQIGMPKALRKAQVVMAHHYLTEARIASSLQKVEAKLGVESIRYNGPNSEIVGTSLSDDDYWTVNARQTALAMANPHPDPVVHSRYWFYGLGELSTHSKNGFWDYVPRGKGKTTARNFLAHIEVRKVWLEHMGDLTAHDRESRLRLLMEWRPRRGVVISRDLDKANKDALVAACAAYDAFKKTLADELKEIEAAAAAEKQEKVHARDQDNDDAAQPQKRVRFEDDASKQ
jgi:hypothetical protein